MGRGGELATEPPPRHLHCRTGGEEVGEEVGLACRAGVGSGLGEGATPSCLTTPNPARGAPLGPELGRGARRGAG